MAGAYSLLEHVAGVAGREKQFEQGDLPVNASSVVLAKALLVCSGAATLYGFTVDNTNAAAQYILVFNMSSIPGNGAIPATYVRVAGNSTLGWDWGVHGRRFRGGIVLANSSTNTTLTAGSADCWFDAQYV